MQDFATLNLGAARGDRGGAGRQRGARGKGRKVAKEGATAGIFRAGAVEAMDERALRQSSLWPGERGG